ncbi:MAG TPA: SAM-dependent methyltransferase [Cyclobacteriaceae bacterium]
MSELDQWINDLNNSLNEDEFIKLVLSKPSRTTKLVNIYGKQVLIKEQPMLSFTYRYPTKDETKNFDIKDGINQVREWLTYDFRIGTLLTTAGDVVLRVSKKGKMALSRTKPTHYAVPPKSHDKQKIKRAGSTDLYLNKLGITDHHGKVIPKMADKYKQINKYLEVMEEQLKSVPSSRILKIVDMGAGKGYLTFALYDFLSNKLKIKAEVIGIEQRKDLVIQCNEIAEVCGFSDLHFEESTIEDYKIDHLDVLIALHACDTATDDAIAKGIAANASLIVCAPCCHKQIRQQVKGKEQYSPILKYGIFKEREFEMVTDTIRALILEKHQYKSNIFEFISNEHTRKNTMLVGVQNKLNSDRESMQEKIDSIKKDYQIKFHYLETLLG